MDLILTLTGGLTAALILGFVAQRLRLSPIVGYLLAGVVVGPFTPGFVAHAQLAHEMAEIGIILLMFGVGLSFKPKELLAVRRVAIPGALVGVGVATVLGGLVGRVFGFPIGAQAVFGLAIGVASTVVLLRVLADNDALHTRAGHVAVGWLVVEDLLTVLVLVLLPVFAGQGSSTSPLQAAGAVGLAVLKVVGLVVFTVTVGRRAVPAILGYVAKTRSRELFTLTVLVLTLGIAVGSARLFGASMALGAFLAGMVVGQSAFAARAASEALPMRDAFAVLFFVSVGMLFDPSQLVRNAGLVAATLAVVLVGKPLAVYVVVRLLRQPVTLAVSTAAAIAQIGEFSFVIAALGRDLGVASERATQAIVVASMVSITVNPLLVRWAKPLATYLEKNARSKARHVLPDVTEARPEGRYRAIVVGYGPVGRTLTRLLKDNGIHPTVIELNHETVDTLRGSGTDAIHGDASQSEVLRQAGAEDAMNLVFAASGSSGESVIRAAKELNPNIHVMARAAHVREVIATRDAGAHVVVTAEAEVALAMTEHLLTKLGATKDQLDRERQRVRRELRGLTTSSTNEIEIRRLPRG